MFDSSGEITPPCGVPLSLVVSTPVFHHPRFEPLPTSFSTRRSLTRAPRATSASRDRGCRRSRGYRRRARGCHPRFTSTRIFSSACVAERPGRNPYEQSWKSTSKIGSRISFAAVCTTRSRTVGIPSGRCFPSAFGMYRRRTACGRYSLLAQLVARSLEEALYAYCSIAAIVWASTPAAPLVPSHLRSTPPPGRHSCRCGRTARGIADPVAAWPHPAADLVGVARFRPGLRPSGELGRFASMPLRVPLRHRRDHPRDPSLRPRCSARPSSSVYYGPLGLPLRRARFRLGLIRATLP